MRIIDALKPWMARFDRLSLRDRAGLVAATGAVMYFVLSLVLVGPDEAKSIALRKRIEAQKAELEAVRKDISELSVLLERDPNAPQLAQLDGLKRTIAEADSLLARLDSAAPQAAGAVLREVLGATPGLELVSLRTLSVALAFQSKPVPAAPAKPAPAAAATPALGAKDAVPKPEMAPRSPRSIYRHGIEISIKGNYLALLPYLEKLERYPGHLYCSDASLDVQNYPVAVLKLTVYTLSGQANPRVG
ncbi:MAG: type II secretion system protein M [Betaproteobacteria bacterium]|nr:type II secretion system protein M [Betaproteobacteria bacterium]